jgi:hypothetical protein
MVVFFCGKAISGTPGDLWLASHNGYPYHPFAHKDNRMQVACRKQERRGS